MLPAINEYNANKNKNKHTNGGISSDDDGDDGDDDATLLTQLFDQISDASRSTNVTKEIVCSDILALISSLTEAMSVQTEIALLWFVMYPKLQEKLANELMSNGGYIRAISMMTICSTQEKLHLKCHNNRTIDWIKTIEINNGTFDFKL